MSMRILNRSFSGGEITPELFGRMDLPKVQESLALCRNFITLPHGPAINRPGTEFVLEVKDSAQATRIIPFSYNNTQTFAVELGAGYFRFHTQAATLQFTTPAAYNAATAYSQGDMCSAGGSNYYCISPTTGNAPPSAAYWYLLPPDLTYEIPNPYAAADLFDIHYTQSADVLTLVHPNYPILELRRYGATSWQLNAVGFTPTISAPSGSGTAGASDTYNYVVTAYSGTVVGGKALPVYESLPSSPASCTNDLTEAGAYNTLTWNPVVGAWGYNVYRQVGGTFYFIGAANGTAFKDDSSKNTTTRVPPATGSGTSSPGALVVTPTLATGFANVTATATGTGTASYKYVATAIGADGSESYMSNVASCTNNLATSGNFNTITVPAVGGATRYNIYKYSNGIYGYIGQLGDGNSFVDNNITPDISLTPPLYETSMSAPGDYPAAVAYYQQRRVFAGSTNQPQNVWATRSGTETDMSYTIPTRDDNRLAFRIAGREASAIRHVVPMQDLLFLSASCEWRCASSTGVLTPATINVQPQSYVGANNVQPVVVGNAVLYAAARGGHIRQMGYNWQINGYESADASIFAPHLFDYNTIGDMAYSRGPVPILWCVSSTGKLLGMTWLPEQKIASWHQHDTGNGDVFESVCTVSENNEDMLYAIVHRTINGVSKRYVERLHTRLYATLADAHYVDCGVTYTAPSVSGSYIRPAIDALTCTIPNHGLANGGNYWFSFSDATYGSLPGGLPYQVAVIDANTFTISVPVQNPLSAAQAAVSGAVDGVNTAFDLLGASGETVRALVGPPAIYKTDWQGKQLQYSTPRTNSVLFSEQFDNAAWGKAHLAITANSTIAPDGATTADTYTPASGYTASWLEQVKSPGVSGQQTFSCYMKDNGGTYADLGFYNSTDNDQFVRFNLVTGQYVSSFGSVPKSYSITSVGNGWYRCTVTATPSAANTIFAIRHDTWTGDGVKGFHIFGAQWEVGPTATSYIPTTSASVTVTDYTLSSPAHTVFSNAPASGSVITWDGSYFSETGTITWLPNIVTGLSWLEGMAVNILADGAVLPPQTVTGGTVTFPVGVNTAHIGLPITAQIQTPPAAQAIDPAMAQGLPKNINKIFLRTYRSSGILAGPDFNHLVPYHQRTVENPGTPPTMVSDEIEIVLDAAWSTSGQVCIQQSDPLPLDIAAMTLEIATGGGV